MARTVRRKRTKAATAPKVHPRARPAQRRARGHGFRGRVLFADGGGFDFFGTFDQLEREFATSAREYEAVCRERGLEPGRDYDAPP